MQKQPWAVSSMLDIGSKPLIACLVTQWQFFIADITCALVFYYYYFAESAFLEGL